VLARRAVVARVAVVRALVTGVSNLHPEAAQIINGAVVVQSSVCLCRRGGVLAMWRMLLTMRGMPNDGWA
jgi:hypothetical protein